MATVPGVKETIEKALRKIEGELQKLYPDALSSENTVADLGFIEEMHFFADGRGKASIILPIDAEMVERIEKGDTSRAATKSMRLVWDMIKSGGLKHTDGEFCFEDGRCLFASVFSAEDMAALDGFGVSIAQSRALQFKFSPLPSELQEALNYEKAND